MGWNRPRSVRQVGSVPGKERIYVEDYVMRFVKELAAQRHGGEKAAMLLGNLYHYNGEKMFQVSGIVEIPEFAKRSSPILTSQMWDWIYTEIKENFTDLEIVGWLYTSPNFNPDDASKLLEIHKGNFQQRDKILFVYEENHEEEGMFMYRMGNFDRQKGYYIYYEKNPEMYQYIEKENRRHVHTIEQEDDRVVRNIRGVIEKKEEDKHKREKSERRRSAGLVTVAALLLVFFFASSMRSQTSLNQVKGQLRRLQNLVAGNREEKTTVETIGSGLVTASPEVATGSAVSGGGVE